MEQQQQEEDRISKLPDEILHQILSKIDIKQAVETSILSERWKTLWYSVPNLDFRRPAIRGHLNSDWFYHNQETPYFTDFVIQFLNHRDHNSTIRKFQLSTSKRCDANLRFVEKCLDYAINHGVQQVELDGFCSPIPFKFPDGLFANKTLKILCLRQYNRSIAIPKPFILPNLKTLYLDSFKFKENDDDHYSFSKEQFSCSLFVPELEKLTLHDCKVAGLIISAS